jgi:hypothetical protein
MKFGIFHEFFFDPGRVPGGGAQFDGVSAEASPGSML